MSAVQILLVVAGVIAAGAALVAFALSAITGEDEPMLCAMALGVGAVVSLYFGLEPAW